MPNFEELKSVAKTIIEGGREIGGKALEQGSKAFSEIKNNAEKMIIENEIKKSKIKLGDMIYQLNIDTGIKEIDDIKKSISNSLEELKYLETKKSI